MKNNILIAPSILSADFANLANEIEAITKAGADIIHIDVMDGHFVENLTIGPTVIKSIRPHSKLPFDVHLMIDNSIKYIPSFVDSGADIISIHPESKVNIKDCINLIHSHNKKAGLAINPETSPEILKEYLPFIDLILLMTVNPGFGGQKFINNQLDKISYVKELIHSSNRKIDLEVDGGINKSNADKVIKAGANILVAGSAVFSNDKLYKKNIKDLRCID
ncbi:ribulose-phosphate 3-epimerase [Alphaproteobacteria bacterium]|nr:ribulose-phosphate 3-epimerase [Alphaproteobacteria bacterium]